MRKNWRRLGRWALAGLFLLGGIEVPQSAVAQAQAEAATLDDDVTFRPTVIVRKGRSQGSGTVIASQDGETFVLTAAHVIRGSGPLRVELHRYNLGLEARDHAGPWPQSIPAVVAGRDDDADVAVLLIAGMDPLPYVAKLAELDRVPLPGTPVTSLGIDVATSLSSWNTQVRSLALMRRSEEQGEPRYFLVTDQAPVHGRSGGGLFLNDGRLLGVCVGRIERKEGEAIGIFASGDSIRRVLREVEQRRAVALEQLGELSQTGAPRSEP